MAKLKNKSFLGVIAILLMVFILNSRAAYDISLARSLYARGTESVLPVVKSQLVASPAKQEPANAPLEFICPEEVSTYTDINECTADISYGLDLQIISGTLSSLTWIMTGANEDASPRNGVNQLYSYVFNEGTTTITYTARDKQGNIQNCTFDVIVSDNQVPKLVSIPENISVNADAGECGAHVTWTDPVVEDNCAPIGQIIVNSSHQPGAFFPIGTTRVTYSVDDGMAYNINSFSFTVTVTDGVAPELNAAEIAPLSCNDKIPGIYRNLQEFVAAGGVASDNCALAFGSFKFIGQSQSGSVCPYTITRTYEIADNAGTRTVTEQVIKVEAETAQSEPVIPMTLKSGMADYTATQSGPWSSPATWGGSGPPTASDNVTIPAIYTVTVDAAAVCQSITIDGTLNHSGATTLQVYGNWTNNGTYNGGTSGTIEFIGAANATIAGNTNFEELKITKGSLNTTLTITGTNSVTSGGSLTMTSGLVTIPAGGSFSVNPSSALDIEKPAGFDVTGGSLSTGNFSITNEGLIRISSGTANFGNTSGNEVHTQVDGAFIVSGGNVNIAGRLYNSASGTLTPPGVNSGITISAGTVTLSTFGNGASSTGSLHVTSAGNFAFTGGTVVFQNPSNAGTELDLGLLSGGGTKNISGGTFQFGNGSSPVGSVFDISSQIPLYNITTGGNASIELESTLILGNPISLNGSSKLFMNGNSIQIPVSSLGAYTFPVSDASGNLIPVTINLSSGTFAPGAYINIATSGEHPNNNSATNYLTRTWTVTTSGITNPNFNITATYANADVTGDENGIALGSWGGGFPWTKGNAVNAGANTVSVNGITTSSYTFTGITLAAPTVSISTTDATICVGESTSLTANPLGDPGWSYSWSSAPAGFSSAAQTINVSPSINTTYIVEVTDGNGFTANASQAITVNPLPVVTLAVFANVCIDAAVFSLSGGSPSGGTYTGTGVSGGQFNPATAGVGAHTITYFYTDANGCSNSADRTITVNPLPVVTLSSFSDICVNAAAFSLSGGSPAGGSYSGPGVSGGQFDPAVAGVGTHTITYSYTDANGCSNSATQSITVNALPVVTLGAFSDVCINTSAFSLSGGSPSGGTYSGPGVSGGQFNPATAGVGTHTITYSYTDANGCTNSATGTIIVHPITTPTVSITANPGNTICQGSSVTFTTLVGNAGANPTFQWYLNGNPISGETGSSYLSNTLANTDKITVRVTADAPCPATTTSNQITMTVNPLVTPSVTIVESANNICAGSSVTFSAVIINGGTSPGYQWKLNGSNISGATSSTYTSSSLVNGDQISLDIVSNANCASPANATSNIVTMTVNPLVTPSVSITESVNNICPGTTVTFTAATVNGGTIPSYQWKVNGVNVGSNLSTYSTSSFNNGDVVTVVLTSNANCASPTTATSNGITMTVNPGTPAVPGAITGSTAVCPSVSVGYSVTAVTNATSYTWTVPSGWTITAGQGTNSITVTTGVTGENGTISVTASNSCGTSAARTLAVTVNSNSVAPTGINVTNNNTCFNTNKTLTVTGGSLGTGAQWEWFTGSCGGTAAGTGSSITVNPAAGTTTTYFVRAAGTCNTTACAQVDVVVSPAAPAQPGTITGTTPVCPAVTGLVYSIAAVTNATNYTWSVPTGWSITAGQGTTSITVTSGSAGQNGNISVTASNSCGTSTAQTLAVTVNPGTPAVPGAITGATNQCINQTGLVYSITAVPNATSYTWTVPSGWTITAGATTNSITVSTGAGAVSGNITVTATNSCGTSAASTLAVVVSTGVPATPVAPTGPTSICTNAGTLNYTVTAVAGATSYSWTLPSGWSITSGSGTNSISVSIGASTTGGNISVRAVNACGTSAASPNLAVSVGNYATADAGPDQSICFSTATVNLNGIAGGAANSTKGTWTTSGSGAFGNPMKPSITYTPSAADRTAGSVTLTFTTENPAGSCDAVSDQLILTIRATATASISGTTTICSGTSSTVTFTATPNTTVTYTVNGGANQTINVGASGTATLNTGNLSANATYALVNVYYTTAPSCIQTVTGSATVTVNPVATAEAGPDQTVCAAAPATTLAGSVGGAATSGTWSGGTGTFNPNNSTLNAVYTPSAAEIAAGTVTLTLTTNDPAGPCGAVTDLMIITISPAATVNAGPDQTVCASSPNVTLAGSYGGPATAAQWSGGTGSFSPNITSLNAVYTPTAAEIAAGSVTLTLTTNDPLGPCGAVSDQVTITINPITTVNAGTDQAICAGSTVTLAGVVGGGASTGTWSGGAGTFSPDNTTLTATYTPSGAEIADGTVTLTLTTNDPAGPCNAVSDQMIITINPVATVNAGIDQTICQGSNIILAGSIGGAATSATWSGGTGTFTPNNTTLNATYTPGIGETGSVTLTLTTNDPAGSCPAVTDQVILTIEPSATVTAGPDQMICSDATATVTGTFGGGATSASWSTSGNGTFDNVNSATAVYTPSAADINNGFVTLTYTTNDPAGLCGAVSASVAVTIKKVIIITSQPVNTGVCATLPADLSVSAVGDNLTYQWYKGVAPGGVAVSNSANITGAQSSTLHFNNATAANAGSYYVVISSTTACDIETSNTVTLNVDEEITITSQFLSNSVCIGGSITFTIVAEPGGSLTYQWRKNGIDIPGATTNSLTLSNVTLADSASYDVHIMGLAGYTCTDAYSASAILTVIRDATISPLNPSDVACLNTAMTPVVFTLGGGATGASVTAGPLPPGVSGSYDSGTKQFTLSGTPTSTGSYNYTITTTGNCVQTSTSGTITVNPLPTVAATPATQTICPGGTFTINVTNPNSIPGTTFSWTRDNTVVLTGTPDSGTGNTITGTLNSSAPATSQTTTFTITPTAAGCPGTPITVTVTVIDNTPPVKPTLSVINVACSATITPPTTTDNCSGTVTGTTTTVFPITTQGQTIVTWTFTDAAGNSVTADQVVNINDIVAPVWDNPAFFTTTVNKECDDDTSPAAIGIPTATDNCGTATIAHSDVIVGGGCPGQYTIQRTWTATDAVGNVNPKTQTIYVSDNTKPILICRDTTVANPDEIYPPSLLYGLSYSDNCAVSNVYLQEEYYTFDESGGAGFCPLTVVRRYVVYDLCGNVSLPCEQTITVASPGTCEKCQDVVPYKLVDLNNAPDSTWSWEGPSVPKREGQCCLSEDPNPAWGCISFNVYLDEDAVGLVMDVEKPAPSGVEYYRIDCGDYIPLGEIICLSGGRFYTLTFCKPGDDRPNYIIQSIAGAITADSLTTRADVNCFGQVHVSGLDPATINWSVVYPPGADYLLKYLDTVPDIANPMFFPDSVTPALIIYEVCGTLLGAPQCEGTPMTDCAEIIINTLPPVHVNLDIDLTAICEGAIPPITAQVPNEDPLLTYSFRWFAGTDTLGALLSTNRTYQPTTIGSYTVKVTEVTSGIGCNEDLTTFNIAYDLEGPILLVPPVDTLMLDCSNPNPMAVISAWYNTARAYEAEDTTVSVQVFNDFSTINIACGEFQTVHFWAEDACRNISRDSAYILVVDNIAPVISPMASDSIADCNTINKDLHPGYLDWIANHGGARATDDCPGSLVWSVDTASVNWVGNGARDSITVTFTVTDVCGNYAQTTATFVIIDDQPPAITCPPSVQEIAAANLCSKIPVTLQDPIIDEDCSIPVLTWVSVGALDSTGTGTVAGVAFPVGFTRVTYTITDAAGLWDSCSFTVTIVDTIPPGISITGCQDVTETFGATDCEVVPATINDPTYTDNCWPVDSLVLSFVITGATDTTGFGSVNGLTFNVGVSYVEYTVTDPDGNEATCSFTVTILRADIPYTVINCPPSTINATVAPGDCDAPVTLVPPTITEYCVSATYTITNDYSVNPDTIFPVGTTIVTWTIADNSGNDTTCVVTVTVTGTNQPDISCPPNVSGTMSADGCYAIPPTIGTPTYSAPCWPIDSLELSFHIINGAWDTTGTGLVNSIQFPAGVNTVWYIVTDPDGNKDSCSFTVSILRDAIPSTAIICPTSPAPITLGPTDCDATLTLTPPTINEFCVTATYTITNNINGGPTIINHVFDVGTTRVVWYIEDNSGNRDSCIVTVEVNGVQYPDITCPPSVTGTMSADGCYAIPPTIGTPTYSAPCWPIDSLDLSFHIINGAWDTTGTGLVNSIQFPAGVNTVWYIVTDPDGNKDSCSFTVSILRDAIPSTAIICPASPAPITLGPTDCDVTLTLPPPTINEFCVTATYTITNNINGGPTIINHVFDVGTTRVVWYIEDNSGNRDSCIVTVEVNGIQYPDITCPPSVTGTMSADGCYAIPPTIGTPTYSAPCWPIDSLELSFHIINGAWDTTGTGLVNSIQFPAGVNTVWYIVTDPDGNKDSCSFTVSILRDAIPSTAIICPTSPAPITLGPTDCDVTLTLPPPTINEFCVTATYTITNNINGGPTIINHVFDVGTTRVVWYIEDNSGNRDSCIVTVEVNGIQYPDINCPPSVTGTMSADGCYAIPPTIASPVYSAPCWPIDSLELSFHIINGAWDSIGFGEVNGIQLPAGVNTIWYIVTDPDGNKDSCAFTASILRDAIPSTSISCPPSTITTTVAPGNCDAPVTLVPPTVSEFCVTATYTITNDYSVNPDTLFPIGTTIVTWTIADNSGNDTTCVVTVVVNDLLPTLICPPDIVVQADYTKPYASGVVVPIPFFEDNCDSTLTWVMSGATVRTVGDTLLPDIYVVHSPDTFNLGVTTITYTFEDGHGHVVTCDFTITVLGAPDIECPPDTTVYLNNTHVDCEATFDPGIPDLLEGTPPITWTYTITFPGGTTQTGTYVSPAPGFANPLGNITFPLGTTTIAWRAENISGYDTCSHWILVLDTLPPVFTTAPFENCVDELEWAIYNTTNPNPVFNHIDPNLEKSPSPDYRTFEIGDTALNLLTLSDNCCDSTEMTIHWRIDFADTPDPISGVATSHPSISGTGQPSEYVDPITGNPTVIRLWGDGVLYTSVMHTITYWVEDCNGNRSDDVVETIIITPRPEIIKMN